MRCVWTRNFASPLRPFWCLENKTLISLYKINCDLFLIRVFQRFNLFTLWALFTASLFVLLWFVIVVIPFLELLENIWGKTIIWIQGYIRRSSLLSLRSNPSPSPSVFLLGSHDQFSWMEKFTVRVQLVSFPRTSHNKYDSDYYLIVTLGVFSAQKLK